MKVVTGHAKRLGKNTIHVHAQTTGGDSLSLDLDLDSALDQEDTGGSTDESGTDGPNSVDLA
jgi:hypothetical protein